MSSINEPIVQLKAVELMPTLPTFLWDMLVTDRGAVAEGEAIWDYFKGGEPMAPFVAENVGGVVMERSGYTTKNIEFPTLAPERPINRSDIMTRSFGEAVYGGQSPEQRAKKLTAKDLKELKDSIQRRREWMVAQLLLTGKVDIPQYVDGGLLQGLKVADFDFTNFYTPVKPWSDPDGDPDADFEEMFEMVTDGLGNVELVIMGKAAAHALMRNQNFLKKRDIRNVYVGAMHPKHKSMVGVTYLGTTSTGIELFSYTRKYRDDKGQQQPFMPDGKIASASKGMFTAYHGPVTQIEKDGGDFKTYIAKEVPFKTSSVKSNSLVQRMTSRPMVVPLNVDAWAVGNVL